MATKGSGAVVVLAVNVVSDRAAESHKFSSWSNWKKPSLRNEHLKNSRQAHAALRFQDPSCRIEAQEVVEREGVDDRVAVVEAAIAVAPAKSVREDRSIILR